MKDYHFEREDRNLDETIRLDDINETLKELESDLGEDELGDKNDFLNAFESEKFDSPPQTPEPPAEPMEARRAAPRASRHAGQAPSSADAASRSKKTIGLVTAVAVVACILCFFAASGGFQHAISPEPQETEAVPMLVESLLDEGELVVYDIKADRSKTVTLTEETALTDEQGRSVAYGSIPLEGDLVMVKLDETGEHALSIDYSGGIHSQEITGLTVYLII